MKKFLSIIACMLVCFVSVSFAGCSVMTDTDKLLQEDIASLETTIGTLKTKVESLESENSDLEAEIGLLETKVGALEDLIEEKHSTSEAPETSQEEEFSIESLKDAYDAVSNVMMKTIFDEDGNINNIKINQKTKAPSALDWESDTDIIYGQLTNGIAYQYQSYGNVEYLCYGDSTGVYTLSIFYDEDGSGAITKIEKSKTEYATSTEFFEYLAGMSNLSNSSVNVKSYEKLSNGNYNIVMDVYWSDVDTTENITVMHKNMISFEISSEGALVSEHVIVTGATTDHETGVTTEYTKTEEIVSEVSSAEVSDRIFELISIAQSIELK